MAKTDAESLFTNPFIDDKALIATHDESSRHFARYAQDISDAALEASNLSLDGHLPTEEEAVERAIVDTSRVYAVTAAKVPEGLQSSIRADRDYIVSFRAAFQGFIVSAIDNSPSEICVVSLRNLNVLASWNTLRTTASTMYFTVTSLQGESRQSDSMHIADLLDLTVLVFSG